MSDPFEKYAPSPVGPATHAVEVTPSDDADLATIPRALWIGVGGDVRVTTIGGETVTFKSVQDGAFPVRVTRVYATGTTATDIVAVW
ncbi:hypothetical protein ABID19_001231 [Mesorhizobium robiniae]|uniref:Uncharacterized protein n=1 Tax=Mesorhizobium robiniae TaxID=559315 RepID=A0ABV2GJ85_9HYPH